MNKRSSILLIASIGASTLAVSSFAEAAPCGGDREEVPDSVCAHRDIYFMPGVDGVMYAPNGKGNDPFFGAGVHFAPYQWSHNDDHFGPGQGALFVQASLLRSRTTNATMELVESGVELSFERNASRSFVIPYFGDSFGGEFNAVLPKSGYDYPFLGVHGVYTPHVMFDVQGGYIIPTSQIDVLRGPRAEAVLRVSMW